MSVEGVPVVGRILAAGPDDSVFDALVALGPLVIVGVALLGRSAPGLVLALAYIAAIVANVFANAVR